MPESPAVPAALPTPADPAELSAEDAKLVVLARGARGRVAAVEGAAVRDQDGRTYAAASVALPSLTLTALQLAVASAVAAGANRLEAAVVVTEASTLDGAGHAAVRDLSADAPIHVAAPDGAVLGTVVE
ncbi:MULTISPECIES: cytidine deaminase [unclassified Micromonospora]|uniref:cytidine deaminase n=1 Tax=unclassified Micromonospora TaxID=2617518 RepID=UPI001B361380|nr:MULTISPECIES: cytidine deaminase [unclassified Micromonospora]MBQ1045568.1 cytidine deaminase [Micromonospora sp. C72]MBQ1058613.1 cytidine deaminase [Micromonospora sp. C32]